MNNSFFNKIKGSVISANRWLIDTPERALDQAYEAALKIRAIEDEYFDRNIITLNSSNYSKNVLDYFQSELKKYLNIINVRLIEFRASQAIAGVFKPRNGDASQWGQSTAVSISTIDRQISVGLEKLKFIDEVLARYQPAVPAPAPTTIAQADNVRLSVPTPEAMLQMPPSSNSNLINDVEDLSDKTGILPRSILKTIDQIRRDLDPQAEVKAVQTFRASKTRTVIAIQFILLLIIIPLLSQQLAKNFVVGPIVDYFKKDDTAIFINLEIEQEALQELQAFEQELRFKKLIGFAPTLTQEQIDEQLTERAKEIAQSSKTEGLNSVKNVFADIISIIVFAILIIKNRTKIEILKSFMDEIVYGLSDSAKAFIIILFTDMFVGFHSPHGWEVLLDGVAKHLGLPSNHDFIFLFIATFPVILDTIFKYWIFRYLNRISPSAVATYREMNE
jgi:uncharacterized integral membrane protein